MKVYTADGRLKISAVGLASQIIAGNTTLTALVDYIWVQAACTITLPAIATVPPNTPMTIKVVVAGNPVVIVDGNGSELIDDELTKTFAYSYSAMVLVHDGSQWRIV